MKKAYLIVFFVAVIAAMIPTLVIAEDMIDEQSVDANYALYTNDTSLEEDELFSYVDETIDSNDVPTDDQGNRFVKIRGKWGQGKDRDFDGYFGGRITLIETETGHRFGVFRGRYNKTGNEERSSLVGIMKNGYFNGKIITETEEYKFTALYSIDRENHLLKLQWMVPKNAGWAVARIQLKEN